MMRANFRLINEIINRVKTDDTLISDVNLELLYKTLESEVIFYLPDPNVFLEFIKNYFSIIIEKYKKIERIYIVVEDNCKNKKEAYKIISKDLIYVIDIKDLPDSEYNSVVIFDDVKNIGNFNDLLRKNEQKLSNFACSFGFTTSPFFFYDLYTATDSKYAAYTPILYDLNTRWFYKKAFENSRIINFKKIEEEIYLAEDKQEVNQILRNLSQFISQLKNSDNSEDVNIGQRLIFLLCNGLYKTNFVLDVLLKDDRFLNIREKLIPFLFTSDKLTKLISEILKNESNDIVILFDLVEISDIVFNILNYELSYLKIDQDINITELKDTIVLEINNQKKVLKFMTYKNLTLKIMPDIFICYDFKPFHNKSRKVILYPKSKKDLFDNLKLFEDKIEHEIRKNLKIPELLTKSKNPNSSKNFVVKVHSNNIINPEMLEDKTNLKINEMDKKSNILYVEKEQNFSYVGAKLAEILKEPVEFDFIKPNYDNICITAKSIEFGSIADQQTFTNSHILKCPTFVFFRKDVILIYSFGDDKNYKFKISYSCLEDFIFVEKQEYFLNFYLCMDRKPKMYIAQNIGSIIRKWAGIYGMKNSDRYNLLESVVWNRCSIEEAKFMKHRDDIKITFNMRNNPDNDKIRDVVIKNRNRVQDNKRNDSKSQENTINRKVRLYDIFDTVISFFRRYQNIDLIFSEFNKEKKGFLSTEGIYEYFNSLEFDNYYYIMCLVSQRERYLAYNMTEEDCNSIANTNIFNIVSYLLATVNRRFTNISDKISKFEDSGSEPQQRNIRQVIVTPLTVIYKMPVIFESNRILREFDYEKFLRVSLREEDLKTKIKDTVIKDQNNIYDYYRNILNNGIFLGPRKYFFVAMTTSQMKLHNAWFLTPYFSNNILIGPDYIRNWLGDFSEIKNIGKYAMRLGQALSSTIPTVDINNFIEIKDNIKNGYNFTDGVGVISFTYAKILAEKLDLDEIPSAFQIRFGGYKGVIVAHPINEEDISYFKDFNMKNEMGHAVLNLLRSDRNQNNKRFKNEDEDFVVFDEQNLMIQGLENQDDNGVVLVLRNSMRKFNSDHRNMECITHSSTNPCYLNRQIINLLEGLGIDISVFLEHQDNYILNLLDELNNNPVKYLRKYYGGIPQNNKVKDLKIFKKLLIQISNKIIRELYKKNKILIENGAVLMGTLDELMVLKENEVFLKVRKDLVGIYDNFIEDGDYCVIIGPCIILKNPCLHPGDVRRVNAVYRPELEFMRNVLVFNQVGDRPIPNMCSGSDLDGDMYTIIWEKTLIPTVFHEPSSYEDQTFLSKEIVCLKDIVNFYIRYIRNFHLGSIAHAHMVYCDRHDVKSENAKLLAELFNKSIDFPRTGFVASVPESLVPISYPDFIQIRGNVYPSFKSLGILYRRSFTSSMNTNLKCECKECLKRFINGLHLNKKLIFQGSHIKFKKLVLPYNSNIKDDKAFFLSFKKDLNALISKYGFNKEDDILLQFQTEIDNQDVLIESKKFFNKIKSEIQSKKLNKTNLLKMSEDCTENINSLPLSFSDQDGYDVIFNNLYNFPIGNFPYNSKVFVNQISIKNDIEEIINVEDDKENDFFDKRENDFFNKRENDKINVFTDIIIYKKFMDHINRDFDDVFSEIFNLLFLSEFFDPKSFDLVFVFFLYLQSKCKSKDRFEISKALFKISRDFYKNPTDDTLAYFLYYFTSKETGNFYLINIKKKLDINQDYMNNTDEIKIIIDRISRTISTVGYLLMFDINLIQKFLSIKCSTVEENYQKTSPSQSYIKKGGQGDLVIKGMFDTSDELKLEVYQGIKHITHKDIRVFSPKLMNQGFCEIETHKINVKEFFINAYFNCLYSKLSTSKIHLITITILPGKFYIYDVPNNCLNEIMTIETLSSSLQFYKKMFNDDNKTFLKGYFFNNNALIEEGTREEYMKNKDIVFEEKVSVYTFSMFYCSTRYQVYYDLIDNKFVVKYITRGRSVAGKVFVINDAEKMDKDVSFEILYEEIIFNSNVNNMTKEEEELFSTDLISCKNNIFVVSKSLRNCKTFRFEIDIKLIVKGYNIELINRKIYTGLRDIFTLDNCNKRLVVSSMTTNGEERVEDVNQFINLFERSWANFIRYYA